MQTIFALRWHVQVFPPFQTLAQTFALTTLAPVLDGSKSTYDVVSVSCHHVILSRGLEKFVSC